jgi:hypothetical protein
MASLRPSCLVHQPIRRVAEARRQTGDHRAGEWWANPLAVMMRLSNIFLPVDSRLSCFSQSHCDSVRFGFSRDTGGAAL